MKVVSFNLSLLAIHYWLGKCHFCRALESHRIRAVTSPEPGKKRCCTLFLRISSINFACLVPFKHHCFYLTIWTRGAKGSAGVEDKVKMQARHCAGPRNTFPKKSRVFAWFVLFFLSIFDKWAHWTHNWSLD